MAENRFFILEDEEYDDVEPCIRDRTFKIKDIYGHYKYDDLEEICNELNRLNNENEESGEDNYNCENCHHYNSLVHWEEGLFHQCMRGNKLWEKCNDYDAIKKEL